MSSPWSSLPSSPDYHLSRAVSGGQAAGMGEAIGQTLPLAVGVAISPLGLSLF
jgi:hypothetical protein